MKNKINLFLLFFLFLILLKLKIIKTSTELNLDLIVNKNKIDINKIYNNITIYETKNKLFEETKQILKNNTFGHELFEEDFDFLNNCSETLKKYDESLEHRLTPETLFEYENKISGFNLISTKSITKDDTGHFVSILLLVGQNNSLIVSDLFGNIYLTYNITAEINDIISYNQNEINDFYIVTNNYTVIKKFILLQGLFYKNNKTNNDDRMTNNSDNVINVDTYVEDNKREKIEKLSYNLVDIYRLNIKEQRVTILEEKNIYFNINNNTYKNNTNKDEYIININPVIAKGVKSLVVVTNKKSVYTLNYQNLNVISYSEIEPKNISNYSNTFSPVTMTSYYILFNKYDNGFIVTKTNNVSFIVARCELFPENSTEKIKNYFFDQKSRTMYILSNSFNIYLVTPMLIQTSHESFKNSCKILFISKLNKIINNTNSINIQNYNNYRDFYISLLNKKLMITNNGIDFEVIDLTNIGEVDNENKLQTKIFSLNQFISDKITNYIPLILKNNNKYLFLYQIKYNSLLLFNFHEKNSKIYKSEPQSFNFKVPIILVAFIFILIWNYLKKKNENSQIGDIDLKNTINQIKEDRKKVKED